MWRRALAIVFVLGVAGFTYWTWEEVSYTASTSDDLLACHPVGGGAPPTWCRDHISRFARVRLEPDRVVYREKGWWPRRRQRVFTIDRYRRWFWRDVRGPLPPIST